MKNLRRTLALICALVLCVSLFAGCKKEEPQGSSNPAAETSQPSGTNVPVSDDNKINYIVTLKSAGGLPLKGVTLLVYADAGLSDLKGYGLTDDKGQAVIALPAGGAYYLDVTDAPKGYHTEDSYKLTDVNYEIVLTSQVITEAKTEGGIYKLGDVMHEVEFTDTKGNTQKLSEVLKEKDMVLLNFWYDGCTWCDAEFPYMQAVYEQFSDKVEIFALSPIDELPAIEYYQNQMELTFPMGQDLGADLLSDFYADPDNEAGFPTSVVIDRYGVICIIEPGALPSEDAFTAVFNAFVGDNYTQKLYENGAEEVVPEVKPNVEMPAPEEMAAVLNQGGLDAVYSADEDDEMSWPFIITQKGGADCITPSNSRVSSSYAMLYAHVTMKAGEALAMDYWASCETGADVLYVLVDRNDIYQISGEESGWKTCYPWVATEDGTYEVVLCYLKDGTDDVADDAVYVKNLRTVDAKDVDVASYIPRFAATNMNEDGFGYQDYITPVFNQKDGYYHVNSADGPLLMANLMLSTRFSNDSIFLLAESGHIVVDGVDYYDQIVTYCSYSSNSQIYSMVPVNEELKGLLQKVTEAVGIEKTENEWLQICEYYDAYGTGGAQLGDPTVGLAAHSAFTAKLGTNSVTYDRPIMPRGLLYRFVPDKSGAYRITSKCDFEVEGWIFLQEDLEDRERLPFYTYEANERMYYSETDISMVAYLEAGKEYFIDIAYADIYGTGTFTFDIEYEGKELKLFIACAPGPFTYEDETTYEIVTGGIDVALGKDGYYHELLPDGSLGSIIYADFVAPTSIFPSNTIEDMLELRAFNFALTEDDQTVLTHYSNYQAADTGKDFESYMKEQWGDDFSYYWETLKVDEVLDGVYHGSGKDMTAVVQKYLSKMEKSGDKEGCVAVTEELAQALQMAVDKFSFKDVEDAWIKFCYYYDYFGPDANK